MDGETPAGNIADESATLDPEIMTIARNDPCPCGSGRKYKHCCLRDSGVAGNITPVSPGRRSVPPLRSAGGLPTERVMADIHHLLSQQEFENLEDANAFLQRTLVPGGVLAHGPRTPIGQAQDLMYRAWEEPSRARRTRLAREALDLSPDCADAYTLLAQEALTAPEAEALYTAGCAAGERALGSKTFRDNAGHFWGLVETRPYMRARLGLANALAVAGRHDEALAHYRELLRLNPGDNQGVRYVLAAVLYQLTRDEELAELLDRKDYRDDASAVWLYTRALVTFRRQQDSPAARTALGRARRGNPHVAAFLAGARRIPKRLPDHIGFGDESEAVAYAAEFREAWRTTPGALAWLEHLADTPSPSRQPRR